MSQTMRRAGVVLVLAGLAAAPWFISSSAAAPASNHVHSSNEPHSHEPVTTEAEAKRRWNPSNDKRTKIKKNDDGTFTITRETPLDPSVEPTQ